ncbi:MAG: phytanoyl-CoA dioxygenase family protein [Planctomycetota bacterium]|nr:phytanoyl-CoA dioxygenase family protein [Planctomycetota bacterium]
MELTFEQKKNIYDQGYVQLPGLIPRAMIDQALQAINWNVGQGMNVVDMPIYHSQSFAPEVKGTSVIADIFNKTPVFELCESAVEKGQIPAVKGGQVALRFPHKPNYEKPMPKPKGHIDGTYAPNNGVPEGEIHNFTMLVGVLLSDLPKPYSGNFTVWPGTHWKFAEYYRKHGTDALAKGMPELEGMGEPLQITGNAGDVIFAHHMLAHTAMPNFSPHVRYALFFRVWRTDRNGRRFLPEAVTDLFHEWTGIRRLFCSEEVAAAV